MSKNSQREVSAYSRGRDMARDPNIYYTLSKKGKWLAIEIEVLTEEEAENIFTFVEEGTPVLLVDDLDVASVLVPHIIEEVST